MGLDDTGLHLFAPTAALRDWVDAIRPKAVQLVADPEQQTRWLRCGGTWFAGVNLLPNDATGRIGGGPALPLLEQISALTGDLPPLDQAQLSTVYPDYPQPMEGESPAAFRFRRDRDAAHVDGLLPEGPRRRRHLREPHAWVLGIPLSAADEAASPMVIWDGSHHLMRQSFADRLNGITPERWGEEDLTDCYHAARRTCFVRCKRAVVHVPLGGAYLTHRLALHGVAPWDPQAKAAPEGRIIAYFRPELSKISDWLS